MATEEREQEKIEVGKKRCDHEPDFETAGISDYVDDELCEVGGACRKCGESGFVVFRPGNIEWNPDD